MKNMIKSSRKINLSLKTKLTISYVFLSLLIVILLLLASRYFLEKKFQNYIINTQEQKNMNIVDTVTKEYSSDGKAPDVSILESIGNTALAQGMVLMVSDLNDNQLFCMSTKDSESCSNMIDSMCATMANIYPGFEGEYDQKTYDIIINSQKAGTVTIGYYGPFYYDKEDIEFLSVLNRIFFLMAVVFLIVAAMLGYVMADRISKPIKKVIDKTRKIEKGNYTDRLTASSTTLEINQLIHSVNSLADTLEHQQISKKRMARDYAHEFRTPLTTLQLSLEAMIDGIWQPTNERLESCKEEILRLTRMISEMDKLVKIEDDSLLLCKTEFDLAGLAAQASLNFQADMSSKNINFQLETSPCSLSGDKDKITQVMINLLSNAIKYTDNGGNIKVRVKKNKDQCELTVIDTGIGISEEDLPNIYEHLYRADKSRCRVTGGSGIGLSVVKAIVDAHQGTIETKSELGKGSEFKVILPVK